MLALSRKKGERNLVGNRSTITVGRLHDGAIPAGFAPFTIQNINGWFYVAYAKQDANGENDFPGPGQGIIDIYSTDGMLIERLTSRGHLNAPWGMALAPADFGPMSGALLVGNFGDGRINAFNPLTGKLLGTVENANHEPIRIEGLWGLSFGNGEDAGSTHTLFFTAGIDNEAHGLFGSIDFGNVRNNPPTVSDAFATINLSGNVHDDNPSPVTRDQTHVTSRSSGAVNLESISVIGRGNDMDASGTTRLIRQPDPNLRWLISTDGGDPLQIA